MKIKWLDWLQKTLNKLEKNVKKISWIHNMSEICDDKFMKKYTNFSSFDEMLSYSWFTQDFQDIWRPRLLCLRNN